VITQDGFKSLPCVFIEHVPLQAEPKFLGLSYVWGDATQKFPILLNGHVFHVTLNLLQALERLQHADYTVPIWIDAICINQADEQEKGQQIKRMGDIYRSAQLVVGMLGPAADNSDTAMKALGFLGQQALDMPDGPCLRERLELAAQILPTDTSDSALAFPTAAVVALMGRPWWQRIWIVQEVVLAKNVYMICGDMDVPFYLLSLAFAALFELPMVNAYGGGALEARIAPLRPIFNCSPRLLQAAAQGHAQDRQPLLQRINEAQCLQAKVTKDHIYALLGMVSDIDRLGIRLDYSKSCAEAFTQVAQGLLVRQRSLQILSRCQMPKRVEGLPSWVPDWSQRTDLTIWDAKRPLYRAGGSDGSTSITIRDRTLGLSGALASIVKEIGPSWNDNDLVDDPRFIRGCLAEIEAFARKSCHAYYSDQELDAAIYRTPILDSELSIHPEQGRIKIRAGPGARAAFAAFRSVHDSNIDDLQLGQRADANGLFLYKASMVVALSGRCIFATDEGYLGLGPRNLKAGDLMCVVPGAEVPFALRERDDRVGRLKRTFWRKERRECELVGECYVHGIMDGEHWKGRSQLVEFSLC
jgi:Heterokaryon incompatibility protein (HET)